jgi:hypothetical protein
MARSEWRIEQGRLLPYSLLAIRYSPLPPFAARGKLTAMRLQSTGEPASMSAQSAQLLGTIPRWDRR